MRQDELDLVQTLSSAPVLYGGCPTVTGVTQAVSKDDGCRVGVDGWENKGLCPAQASHLGRRWIVSLTVSVV